MIENVLLFVLFWNVGFMPVAKNLSMDRATYCKEVLMKLPAEYKSIYWETCREK